MAKRVGKTRKEGEGGKESKGGEEEGGGRWRGVWGGRGRKRTMWEAITKCEEGGDVRRDGERRGEKRAMGGG